MARRGFIARSELAPTYDGKPVYVVVEPTIARDQFRRARLICENTAFGRFYIAWIKFLARFSHPSMAQSDFERQIETQGVLWTNETSN